MTKRLPLLDIKVWIGQDSDGNNRILPTHYIKDVSTRAVLNANSSHDSRMKASVMVNEAFRILKNCSVFVEWREAAGHLTYFMRRLQYSEYSPRFRSEILEKALKKYDGRKREYNRGGSMFQAIRSRQSKKKKNWYGREGQFDSVIFVEPTPNSCFKKEVQQAAKESKLKIRVVEKVSTTVNKLLQKSNPFEKEICGRDDCEMCRLGCKDDCRTRGCVYEVKCKDCDRKYRGTTGRTAYHRTGQHIEDWAGRKSCAMWEHSREYHNGGVYEY